jgi:hypothetical protein
MTAQTFGRGAEDAISCPGSGSANLTIAPAEMGLVAGMSQCISGLQPGRIYNFGGWIRRRQGAEEASFYLAIHLHPGAGCPWNPAVDIRRVAETRDKDGWVHATGEVEIPADIKSATFDVTLIAPGGVNAVNASADLLYVTPAPGRW